MRCDAQPAKSAVNSKLPASQAEPYVFLRVAFQKMAQIQFPKTGGAVGHGWMTCRGGNSLLLADGASIIGLTGCRDRCRAEPCWQLSKLGGAQRYGTVTRHSVKFRVWRVGGRKERSGTAAYFGHFLAFVSQRPELPSCLSPSFVSVHHPHRRSSAPHSPRRLSLGLCASVPPLPTPNSLYHHSDQANPRLANLDPEASLRALAP